MADPDSPPSIFADLIAEVGVAAKHSDKESQEARALSVDPTVVDPTARSRAVDAELIAERLRNAMTALQERHSAAVTREQLTAWHAGADRVQAVRDQLSAELADRYPAITAELVDIFTRIAACDREVGRINASAPGFDQRRLLGVEVTARGIDRFGLNDKRIAETVRLPAFVRGQPHAPPRVGLGFSALGITDDVAELHADSGGIEGAPAGCQLAFQRVTDR